MLAAHTSNELVVNWHITEACNYHCHYCFAKWEHAPEREAIHTPERINDVVNAIAQLPALVNQQHGSQFEGLRLNLVGGEAFLYAQPLQHIIHSAKANNMRVSAITNGSLLNPTWLEMIAENMDSIGFSVDSLHHHVNVQLGRSHKAKTLDWTVLAEQVDGLRHLQPSIHIKLNTVVNELNHQERFHDLLQRMRPDKWKVFKMLPVLNQHYSISQAQFEHFLAQHQAFQGILAPENNQEMVNSYLMIDPLGRFFQNSPAYGGYQYSRSIRPETIAQALADISFQPQRFLSRYEQVDKYPIYEVTSV